MMNNCMAFPETLEEFLEQYQFKDAEEIYTNGSMLIQVFRVKQWAEHYAANVVEVVRCRDCRYYSERMYVGTQFEYGSCDRWRDESPTYPDDFCSNGVKREES